MCFLFDKRREVEAWNSGRFLLSVLRVFVEVMKKAGGEQEGEEQLVYIYKSPRLPFLSRRIDSRKE